MMANELAGTAAHDVSKAIEDAKKEHAGSYLRLGAILLHVRDEKLFKDFGFESFAQFVQEHGLSRSWAYACVAVSERWGTKAQGILPSRLQQLLPVKVDGPEDEETLLESARTYQPEAWHNVVIGRKGGTTTDSCQHEWGNYCLHCGKKFTPEDHP